MNIPLLRTYLLNLILRFHPQQSALVERLFSYAGMILSPNRRTLSDLLFEKMVVLKVNDV